MHLSRSRLCAALVALGLGLAAASPAHATVEWEATAEPGNLSEWANYDIAAADRAGTVTSPVLAGTKAFQLTVQPGDVVQCSTCDRAQLNGPAIHQQGDEDWTSVAVYVPTTYPTTTDTTFWQTTFQWHASPYTGSPAIEMGVSRDATRIDFSHNWWPGTNGVATGNQTYDTVGGVAITRGTWQRFIFHVKWSRYDNEGFFEVWHAPPGQTLQKVTFANGTQRINGATMLASMTGGQRAHADNYRKGGVLPASTLYFDAIRTASTFAEAEAAFGTAPVSYATINDVGSSKNQLTTAGTSLAIAKPAGVATGHLITAAIVNDGKTTITPPTGFTQRCTASTGTAPTSVHVYTKVATASEPASYTWAFGASGKHVGGLTVRSNVDTANPVQDAKCSDLGDGNDMTAPSVTPVTPNGLLVAGGVSSNGITFGTPASMTERFDAQTGTLGYDRAINMATEQWPGTGATGTRLFTDQSPGLGVTGIASYALLLRPATL